MISGIKAGVAYFLSVFLLGMVLGVLRITIVVPRLGEAGAVALELPVILAASWFLAGSIQARFQVPAKLSPRLAMGATAFALLMAGELGVSILGYGNSVAQHYAGYATAPRALGLAAQIVFALMPLIQLCMGNRGRP